MFSIKPLLFCLILLAPVYVLGACSKTSSFIVFKTEVYDKTTGLVWSRCPHGTQWKKGVGCIGKVELLTLSQAKYLAEQKGKGWRLPTLDELLSIVDKGCSKSVINNTIFSDIEDTGEGSLYWTTTVYLNSMDAQEMPSLFYTINFINGMIDAHTQGLSLAVRLVKTK